MAASAVALCLSAGMAKADTLREALISAYETNPVLTGARAGQRAVDENVVIARADGLPSVGAQAQYQENLKTSANSFTSPSRQLTGGVNLTVPIYSGGAVRNAVNAAKDRVQAGQADLRATEASIFSNVVAAYMDVMRDEAIVQLNRANVGVLDVNLQATNDRFEIGDLTRTDVAQSESRLAIARSDLQGAESNLIRSREIYIQLVGHAPGQLEAPPPLPNLPESPDIAVAVALDNNPDLIAARERYEASEDDVRTARASRLPRLELYTQGNYANFLGTLGGNVAGGSFVQEQTTAEAGARVTVPIFQGGQPSARIRQAQARSGQAMENEIAIERDVIAQTRAAYSSWQASLQVIQSSQIAVDASGLALEGVRAENSVGNRTILDILDAEREYLNAQVQLVAARRNAYVAGFSLLAAMGKAEARDLGLDGGVLYDPQDNYQRVKGKFFDWSEDPAPEAEATRTVDTQAQNAAIIGPLDE
ncbi:MAG: TolC family outer membrane protein [Blastomonas sp.]